MHMRRLGGHLSPKHWEIVWADLAKESIGIVDSEGPWTRLRRVTMLKK